jgi:hypothetical protein
MGVKLRPVMSSSLNYVTLAGLVIGLHECIQSNTSRTSLQPFTPEMHATAETSYNFCAHRTPGRARFRIAPMIWVHGLVFQAVGSV